MTSQQFISQLKQKGPGPAYLFIGPEPYQRDFCRKALIECMLPGAEERENGLTRYDLQETPLQAIVDDARSLSAPLPMTVSGRERRAMLSQWGFPRDS